MHGNNFNSLNFQHGGYQDPFADLQQSLGAGGIFSQTLKQMNQDMYANAQRDRADEEFKWRKDDRQRQEQERQDQVDLLQAYQDNKDVGAADIGNRFYQGEKDKIGKGADGLFTAPKDSKYGILNADQLQIDALRQTLLDPKYKDNAQAKAFLDTYDKGFNQAFSGDYSNASKIGQVYDALKASGLSDKDAQAKAAAMFGNNKASLGAVSDVVDSTNMQNRLVSDFNRSVTTDPTIRRTDLEVTADLINQRKKAGIAPSKDLLMAYREEDLAQTAAIAKKKAELDAVKDKLYTEEDKQNARNLELQLKMLELKKDNATALFKGMAPESYSVGAPNGATGYNNAQAASDKYEEVARKAGMEGYGSIPVEARMSDKNKAVIAQANSLIDGLMAKNASPQYIRQQVESLLTYDKENGTLSTSGSVAKILGSSLKASDTIDPMDYAKGNKGGNSEEKAKLARMLYAATVDNNADAANIIKQQMQNGGGRISELQAKLANLQRSPMDAIGQAAYEHGKQAAIDNGWAKPDSIQGYKQPQLSGSNAAVTKQNQVVYGNQSYDNNVAGKVAQSVGLSPFAARMIHEGEGVKDGTEYQMYNDTKRVNGKIVPRPSVASLDFEEVRKRAAEQGINVPFNANGDLSKMQGPAGEKVRAIVDELRGEQYKIAMGAGNRISSSFFNGDQNMSDVFTNFAYQYGANSSVLNKTASKIALNLQSGNVQAAIDEVADHSYGKYADRAKNLVGAIVDYAHRNGIDTSKVNMSDKLFKGSSMTTADALKDYNLRLAKVNGNKDLTQAEKDSLIGGMHAGYNSYGLQWHNSGETKPVDQSKLQEKLKFNSNEVVGDKIDAILSKDKSYNVGNRIANFASNVATFGDPTPMSFSDKTLVGVNNILQSSGVFNKDDTPAQKIAKVQDYIDNGSGQHLASSGAKDAIDYWLHYNKMQNIQNYTNEYGAAQRDAALSGAIASTIPLGAVEGGFLKGAASIVSDATAADMAAIRAELAQAKTAKEVKSLLKGYKKQYPDQIDNITKLYELNKSGLVRPIAQ